MATALDAAPVADQLPPPPPAPAETTTNSITPPNSADGKKHAPEGLPTELSDLELDHNGAAPSVEPVEEDIEPDHYYEGGKIPVFKPTMDQFRDFQSFIQKVNKYGMKSGIVKIIPPQEWRDSLSPLDDPVKSIRVKNPIMQEFHGAHGTYTQANIEKQRSYNLPQWKALCEDGSHQPPARRGERRRNQEKAVRPAAPKPQVSRSGSQKRGPGRPPKKSKEPKIKEESPADDQSEKSRLEGPPTPVSPQSNPVETKTEDLSDGEELPAAKPKGRQPKSVSSRRKHNRGETLDQVDEEAFKDFDYRIHDNDQYTAERCDELETAYWKSLMFNNPMYGADMPGSLFDETTTSWNVAKLPNLLDVLGQKVPGVNTAYLYLGMWKATFAWHLEDVDLYSINYIHFGAPKQWYSISQEDAPRFEAAMKSIWPSDAKNCDQFLRHKTYLISPSILKSRFNITVNKVVHYEGEFMITYPYGYHSGYNLGYNCAESVNFATEQWLDYGRIAKKCNCESDSVWIDVGEIERKLRGEPTPEYYYEDEIDSDLDELDGASDLLTPPRSVPEKSNRGRKRKHEGEDGKVKRIRIRGDVIRRIPCLLCPNDMDYEDLLPTEDGKSHAHRRCATYIEETSILRDESGREVVCDIDKIPKARLGLKCLFCREVRGACFQCNYGKCTRAYHPTCALLAGVQVEFGSIVVIADDSQQYSVASVDLKCKFHRQRRHGGPSELVGDDRKVVQIASRLSMGDLLQFQVDKEINGAIVLENRPVERTLKLKVLPRGDIIELPYRWILVVRKTNFAPLPPGTKPLPAHLARKAETHKELSAAVPMPGTPFGDANAPFQWAEFEHTQLPAEAIRTAVPVAGHFWYYLGATSTECRAQYTHSPSVTVHNPRANFLDSAHPSSSGSGASGSASAPPHHLYAPPNTTLPRSFSSLQRRPSNTAMTPAYRHLPPHTNNVNINSPSAAHFYPANVVRPNPYAALHKPQPDPPTNTFASVRELIARRRLAQITDHANVFAGYKIVSPELVVETLLGPMGSVPPPNGMEKLELAMAQQRVQPKALDGTLLPPQPLNMRSEEVSRLLQMLRFSVVSHRDRLDVIPKREPEYIKQEPFDRPNYAAGRVAGRYPYLEQQQAQTPTVYRSPYESPFGLAEWTKKEYNLIEEEPSSKPSLANDFFASLSPADQEKVVKACGSWVQERIVDRPSSHSRQSSTSNFRFSAALAQQNNNPTIDITTVDDLPMTELDRLDRFDFPLHADSPASSFSRPHLVGFPSPHDFNGHADHDSSIVPRHLSDHHDLFGDQQANTRFWQHGPWAPAGDGTTPIEENRPFFGPHERLKHDYASSELSLGRGGPGSLHSVDMAGFGMDTTEDFCSGLSP
ncbi:putative jumonji family transcription factor [Talaromyces proteolyticus]|uniref:[histone H3]-trimethyl-L-lysine(9) demethylase n=1 Tax=Talaromyces proteolyticus TaxID=1131652 RepID=A0AAD4KWA0_9EURO|nr:putative jumonji family transcription factor [Talaromyces proteolyticus]KAH8698377.1 putative jumonji family transcription factor [Talaromyces proteolyticus]